MIFTKQLLNPRKGTFSVSGYSIAEEYDSTQSLYIAGWGNGIPSVS